MRIGAVGLEDVHVLRPQPGLIVCVVAGKGEELVHPAHIGEIRHGAGDKPMGIAGAAAKDVYRFNAGLFGNLPGLFCSGHHISASPVAEHITHECGKRGRYHLAVQNVVDGQFLLVEHSIGL